MISIRASRNVLGLVLSILIIGLGVTGEVQACLKAASISGGEDHTVVAMSTARLTPVGLMIKVNLAMGKRMMRTSWYRFTTAR